MSAARIAFPKPATAQRRIEKALDKDLSRLERMSLALFSWGDAPEYTRGHVAPAPLLKRIDVLIRGLTKTRRALSSRKGRAS